MAAFFAARLDGYEEHMYTLEGAAEFYPYTASLLPAKTGAEVLDLGCGTGLEMDYYFKRNPTARVTGIDLCPEMLAVFRRKFAAYSPTVIEDSYFTRPLGKERFDAAVSVESLHHFTQAQKIPLYAKLRDALKWGGYFILTDYLVYTDAQERELYENALARRRADNVPDDVFVHIDTPLSVCHEAEALLAAGFSMVERMETWGNTHCFKATK